VSADVLFEERGAAGLITLNRPHALNALTIGMIREMAPRLKAWAADDRITRVLIRGEGGKAFCAGGDVRALYDLGRAQDPEFLTFYREEYALNTLVKRYPKPYVALIGGIVMGGGVGVSIHGSHRVVSERATFAMPETGIGLFPDVGGTYFLPRLPGETGMYLGLTGARLKAADCLYTGLASSFVQDSEYHRLIDVLCEGCDVDAILARVSTDPGPAPLAQARGAIDHHFGGDSIEAILASLEDDPTDWARATAKTLEEKSPTSLKITYRQLREGKALDFEQAMALEYRLVNRIFRGHDFFEGTRAVVIDKDQAPRWRPASLAEVSEAMVDAYFAPLPPA